MHQNETRVGKRAVHTRTSNVNSQDENYSGYHRQRHAEKIVTKKGFVVVKIELTQNPREGENAYRTGTVCVHVFTNERLFTLDLTHYGVNAVSYWDKILRCNPGSTVDDLTPWEFSQVMKSVERATFIKDTGFKRKKVVKKQKN